MTSLRLISFIALCLYCSTFKAFAQCPDAAELNITATLYTQANGLTSNMLEGIGNDSTGFRYFLSVNGKWIRYDGSSFSARNNYDRIPFVRYRYFAGAAANYTNLYINKVAYTCENK